jgi:ferredoxin
MKITVDVTKCEAHGDCVVAAPNLFDLGEDDEVVRVLDADPDEALRAEAEMAVKLCPVVAISIAG